MSREKENRRCCTRSAPSPSQSSLRDASFPKGREQTLSGAPAPAPPEWNDFPPVGGKIAKPERGTASERREPERVLPAARLFPQETSAADAVSLHDPTRENAMPGGPQTARHCSIISIFSAEYAQSTTTTTAASGGNREELLGQRPARRKCRPRHDADAGCRNPIAERIPIVFLRTAPQPPDAPAKRTAMPRCTGSPP